MSLLVSPASEIFLFVVANVSELHARGSLLRRDDFLQRPKVRMLGEKFGRDARQELAGNVQFQRVARIKARDQFIQFIRRSGGNGTVLLLQRLRRVVLAKIGRGEILPRRKLRRDEATAIVRQVKRV